MKMQEIVAVLGSTDEVLAAALNATGASAAELAQAWAWLNADEALVNEGRRLPSGRVADLIEILEAADQRDVD
ncbi:MULTISPECIES: hypothetical protein [Ochrobactrum]|uniref:Uncharacterized protein n=1 Tax=Ochrobactrum quorumnocens TaxID=271865 RepID=A0A5N1JWJ7_9HYPH|nr:MULTISPECIES: hypothetical protein [Brucella/Ochrobactrum group]KAA9368386.1 hypothetical protein F3W84_10905 [[Ochrobactrum] quorumnocens]MBD7991705.1 hypothetical protein [Ochrobactrum gallinarum]MDH7792605.1 hypothetical protein [Ochrobactrum sp. AN78]